MQEEFLKYLFFSVIKKRKYIDSMFQQKFIIWQFPD